MDVERKASHLSLFDDHSCSLKAAVAAALDDGDAVGCVVVIVVADLMRARNQDTGLIITKIGLTDLVGGPVVLLAVGRLVGGRLIPFLSICS